MPVYNRFHRGEWITRVSGGEGAQDTHGPRSGTDAWGPKKFKKFGLKLSIPSHTRMYSKKPSLRRLKFSQVKTLSPIGQIDLHTEHDGI